MTTFSVRLFAFTLAISGCLFAQSGSPGTPTDLDLLAASDHCHTTLTANITDTATSIPLASSTNCVAKQIITLQDEQMKIITPGVPATVERHWSGTTAVPHANGTAVDGRIGAVYNNQFRDVLRALETSTSTATYRGSYPGIAGANASWANHVPTIPELYDSSDTITTLSADLDATSLTLPLTSTGFLGADQIILVGSELMHLCGATTVCPGGRGYDGTTPAAHLNLATVSSAPNAAIIWNRSTWELIAFATDLWGRAGSTTNCPCVAGAGASWPNHIPTIDELGGLAAAGEIISAARQNRRAAELKAIKADLEANPIPPSPPAPPPPPAGTVDILAGPYSGCPGSGCAKGNYRFGTDASVSASNFTLTASSGNFSGADVGKRGVAVDWYSSNVTGVNDNYGSCASWSGYACYAGTSCEFTVASVSSSTSITVNPVQGCGGSGIINSYPGTSAWYWAVYSDDSLALGNALNAAAGSSAKVLSIPANASLGIYTGKNIPSGVTISCASGGTFNDPHLNTSTTFMFSPQSGSTITGCILSGTENPNGMWYDVLREYNIAVGIFTTNFTFTYNTVKNQWGTYAVGTSGGSGHTIAHNTFRSCGMHGVQLNTSSSTLIGNNTFVNCSYGSQDGSASGSQNIGQNITSNTVTSTIGQGYYRTQKSRSLSEQGSVWLDCGTSRSGATPYVGEYAGVSCTNNTITGTDSQFQYSTYWGETVSGNSCTGGCSTVVYP